jgi:hypothetical protein
MKCYWRLIEDDQRFKGDENRRVVSRNRIGASSRSTNMIAEARCCRFGSRAVMIIGSKTESRSNGIASQCCHRSML